MSELAKNIGGTHALRVTIERVHTVPALPIGSAAAKAMPEVLATPVLVAFVEHACMEHIAALLAEAPMSLGTAVQMEHTAPTPIGFCVTITTELLEANGRTLLFGFTAEDDIDRIATGRHTRALVPEAPFRARVAAKAARRPGGSALEI